MPTKTTIHDIARELNYSYGTILRALNLSYFISKKTISAVQEKASELQYQLNKNTSSLRSGKSGKKAFALLMELIVNNNDRNVLPTEHIILKPNLILRESSVRKKLTKNEFCIQSLSNLKTKKQ